MSQRLPETTDFIQQAEHGARLQGSWPIAELERLRELVTEASGELVATLEFGRKSGFYILQGTLEANPGLICQRCLEPMSYPVSSRFKLGLVSSEAAMDELPPDLEPYLVEGEEQSIVALLEDELLLCLPIAPTHQTACSEFLREQAEQQADKESSSPFAVLKDLKLE